MSWCWPCNVNVESCSLKSSPRVHKAEKRAGNFSRVFYEDQSLEGPTYICCAAKCTCSGSPPLVPWLIDFWILYFCLAIWRLALFLFPVWSLKCKLRTEPALSLVQDMIDHAAFASRGRDFYIDPDDDNYIQELLTKGLAIATNEPKSLYTLTRKATSMFRPAIELLDPVFLHHFLREDKSMMDEMTALELCNLLKRKNGKIERQFPLRGWKHMGRSLPRRGTDIL